MGWIATGERSDIALWKVVRMSANANTMRVRVRVRVRLTGLEGEERGTTGVCEHRVEVVVRVEAKGYERQGEDGWETRTHAGYQKSDIRNQGLVI